MRCNTTQHIHITHTHTHTHTQIHTYIHTYIYSTYVHTYTYIYIHTYIHTYTPPALLIVIIVSNLSIIIKTLSYNYHIDVTQ